MKQLIIKYLDGTATKAEQAKLLIWIRQKENRIVFNRLKFEWKKDLDGQQFPEGSEKIWNTIQYQLLQKSYTGWQKSRKFNQFSRIAAIFFFVLSLGSVVYFTSNEFQQTPEFFTSVVAENGQISKVILPDGSTVWLNSGSELSYSSLFATKNRDVSLSGEAYFQITKNEEIPLVVSSGELHVKVLGTKFNVSAYPESEKINVVLESGSVNLLNSEVESFSYNLKPGELATFYKTNRKLEVCNVNTAKFTSWKEGMINIYNQSFEELIKRLETRYNQKFEYNNDVKCFHYTFTIKNESLDEIIKLMEKDCLG